MAKENWQKWNLADAEAVKALEGIKQSIDPAFEIATTVLEATATTLEILANLLVGIMDPQVIALKAAIEAARSLLATFEGAGTGVYAIAIPVIPIDGPVNNSSNSGIFQTPSVGEVRDALWDERIGNGGNYGFLQALEASLVDPGDPFKPQLSNNAYIAGAVLYVGATSYLDVVQALIKLARLFGGPGGKSSGISASLVGDSLSYIPKPSGLSATLVPSSAASVIDMSSVTNRFGSPTTSFGVKLAWRPDEVTRTIPFPSPLTGELMELRITKAVVFRSEQPIPHNLSSDKLGELKLGEYDYDWWDQVAFDDNIEAGKTYYYAVGYKFELVTATKSASPTGKEIVQKSEDIWPSSAGVVRYQTTSISISDPVSIFAHQGVPPDWVMLPSPLALFPDVVRFIDKINAVLDALEKMADEMSAKVKEFVEALKRQIRFYQAWAQEIIDTIHEFIDAITLRDIYVGLNAFWGQGGTDLMMSEIRKMLTDKNDKNRPNFDKGSEVVAGMVFLAAADSSGGLQAFEKVFQLLFGLEMGSTIGNTVDAASQAWEDSKSVWDKAIESIDNSLEELGKKVCLDDNMEQVDCPNPVLGTAQYANEPGGVVSENPPVFKDDLTPATEDEEC